MVGIKTKSLLGLLLIALLLPQVSSGAVIDAYGGRNNVRNVSGERPVNLDTSVNGRNPIGKLIRPTGPLVAEQIAISDRQQNFQRIRQILSSILARLRAVFDPPPANHPPVAEAQSLETTTNLPLEITLSGSDEDTGDTLAYQITLEPDNGVLSGSPPLVTYTPDDGFSGQDSFLFTVNDGSITSDSALVAIDVVKINEPPIANSISVSAMPDTPLNITLSGSDPDNDPLNFQVVTGPTSGTYAQDGRIVTYTPNPGFIGQDSFTFVANDGQVGSTEARVDITIEFLLMMDRLNPDNIDEWGDTGIEGSFGRKVDISGDVAIASIPDYYKYIDEFNALHSAGAAQIYRYDGNSWQAEALLPPPDMYIYEFGSAVAINGNIAAVGATDYWLWDDDYGEYATSGAVYIYRYNHSTRKWQMEERIVPSNPNWLDLFGASIEINGDRIIVGAPNAYNSTGDVYSDYGGAAFVFKYGYDSLTRTIHWFEEGKLVSPQYTLGVNYLGDDFGISVSMRGNLAVVGARLHDNNTVDNSLFTIGAAYLYKYDALTGWTFDTKLHAGLDLTNVQDPRFNENDGDFFGNQVALGDDVLVVGANSIYTSELSGSDKWTRGAVYIYKRNHDGTWGPDFTQKLVNSSDLDSYDDFGLSLDIDLLNNLIVSDTFETARQAEVTDPFYPDFDYMGVAYIYQPDQSGVWTQVKAITPDVSEMTINDIFGWDVAVDGCRYMVGVDYQDVCLERNWGCLEFYKDIEAESAYIYMPAETRLAFTPSSEIVPPDGNFTLNWDSSNATWITIEEEIIASDNVTKVVDKREILTSGTVPGSMPVDFLSAYPLDAVATYTATATGPKGTTIKTVTVTVGYSEPAIDSFTVSPAGSAYPNANAILSWDVTGADPSYGGTIAIDHGVGTGLPAKGAAAVYPGVNTTYTITATNPSYTGANAATATVTVNLPTSLVLTSNPATVAGNDVTISWEPNSTANALYLQELDGNGNLLETLITNDPFNTTSYTFTPNSTTTYRLRSSTDSGSIFKDMSVSILDPASLGIAILTPSAGGTINKPAVNVTGLITTGTDEVGVIVNGVIAIVDGNEFFANNVPLDEGPNTIEAIATETNGTTVSYSINVSVDTTAGEWITLNFNPSSGIAPLDTSLSVEHHLTDPVLSINFSCAPYNLTTSCASMTALNQVSETEFDFTFADPGIYLITYEVTDQGGTHSQDILIEVLDELAFDAFLKAKWDGMRSEMLVSNVDGAVSYFHEAKQEIFTQIYTVIEADLPAVASAPELDSLAIDLVGMTSTSAEYWIEKEIDYYGVPKTVVYSIYFKKDRYGLWKIWDY